jgi:hypothetical protein
MSDSEEVLRRREEEDRGEREKVILDEDAAGMWVDCQPGGGANSPRAGDLPDHPPPAPPASLFSRILRALRGG